MYGWLQDKKDDVAAGVKSTALYLADNTKPALALFGASSIALLSLSGMAVGQTPVFYAGVAGAGAHLAWQLSAVNLNNHE